MEEVDLNSPEQHRVREGPDKPEQELRKPQPDDEAPDPRIQVELECLNTSTDTINKLEVDLDESRMIFRQLLIDSTQKIDTLAKRLGKCVDQSRPYYEARIKAKQALSETQKAAVRYERAMSQHAAAREMVFLAEEGLMQKGCIFDATWQEMLNHATSKVNDAETEKIESATDHRVTSAAYHEAETRVKSLQKELKRAIAKSSLNARRSLLQMNNLVRMHQLQLLPYFELKAAVNHQLESQKHRVKELEGSVAQAKNTYSQALHNLETISDEIHRTRQSHMELGVRGVGVGAESPRPSQSADRCLVEASHDEEAKIHHRGLHYTSQVSQDEAGMEQEEFRSLPSKLGAAASPLISSHLSEEFLVSSNPLSQDGAVLFDKCSGASGQQCGNNTFTETAQSSSFMNLGLNKDECNAQASSLDMLEESEFGEDRKISTEFKGWQVVDVSNPCLPSQHQYLTVEDRESIVSDTESLASIEMLSDEAIAGLMLEEELAQASTAMTTGTPLNTPSVETQPGPLQTSHPKPYDATSPFDAIELIGETPEERTEQLRASLMTLQFENSQYLSSTNENIAGILSRPETLDIESCDTESDSSPSSPEAATPAYDLLKNTPNSPDSYSLDTQVKDPFSYSSGVEDLKDSSATAMKPKPSQ